MSAWTSSRRCGRRVVRGAVATAPQPVVHLLVLLGHGAGREAPLGLGAAGRPVDRPDSAHRLYQLVLGVAGIPRYAVPNDLRYTAVAHCQDRRATGERLGHDQAEWLGPGDREQQRDGA